MVDLDNIHAFYVSPEWRKLRKEILAADKFECQICKASGRYTRADRVHHVNHVDKHPEMALQMAYTDDRGNTQRNLISVCRYCHETVCHPERMRQTPKKQPITRERWE
ncbi:MAG: HNH endonuclease [Oscillospiraceae bacterium]